jgi:uncharacterized SAM-binding protein YcdF (DUF218 family)
VSDSISRIVWAVARPSETLVILACVGSIAFFCSYKIARTFMVIGVGGMSLIAFLPIGTWLMRPLEDRFPPNHLAGPVDGIIVLGGAIDLQLSRERGSPTLNSAAGRMIAAAHLARMYPNATVLFTGGNPNIDDHRITEADVAKSILLSMGISPARLVFERASRNTHENAVFSRRIVPKAPSQRWLLVTSAADMPRAVGCFRAVNWPVIPYPADYHTLERAHIGLGFFKGLQQVDWATHEWIGLVYYRLRGWTPSLFPGPIREQR